jgi:transcriptional regulator with XRE-family HTH domain
MSAISSPKPNKDAALHALLAGKSQTDVAEAAGVEPRTIRRWLRDKGFIDRLDKLRFQRNARVLSKIGAAQESAVDTLISISSDPDQKATDRLKAAQTLIRPAIEFRSEIPVLEFVGMMRGGAGENSK